MAQESASRNSHWPNVDNINIKNDSVGGKTWSIYIFFKLNHNLTRHLALTITFQGIQWTQEILNYEMEIQSSKSRLREAL